MTPVRKGTKEKWTQNFFGIFVYWPPFHIFHINLDMMECFVRPPSHCWQSQTPPTLLHLSSLLATRSTFALLVDQITYTSFNSTSVHTHTHTFSIQWHSRILTCTCHCTKGVGWSQNGCRRYRMGDGRGCAALPSLLQTKPTPLSDQPDRHQSLSALVTTLNLWVGTNAVQPTRTGFKSKEENSGVWECRDRAIWLERGTMVVV